MTKNFKTEAQGQIYYIFFFTSSTCIEADRSENDFFTSSNSVITNLYGC